jgi:hypothetical protein
MSILNDITNTLTGGQNSNAQANEQAALAAINNVPAPTQAQLTIPQLQQYVQAGIMTPAQATAYLQNSNAYNNIQLSPAAMAAEQQALAQTQNIAATGGNDAEAQLAMQQALNQSTAALSGEEGANVLQAEQRGVAPGLATEAANEADIGQNANALFGADQAAAAAAEARQLQALSNVGTQAGNLESQTYQQSANQAAAQNAINQFNAQNQTQVSQSNAANVQAANAYNAQEANAIQGQNTQQTNAATIYNSTQAPQTAYEDAMAKAEAAAGQANTLAGLQTSQGQQNASLVVPVIAGAGAASQSAFAPSSGGTTGTEAVNSGAGSVATGANNNPANYGIGQWKGGVESYANGGQINLTSLIPMIASMMSDGGEVSMKKGGVVPGMPVVPGDSPKNDIIPARVGKKDIRLSPGEIVLPRSVAQNPAPDRVQNFLRTLPKYHKMVPPAAQVHPQDVAKVLQALGHVRRGEI